MVERERGIIDLEKQTKFQIKKKKKKTLFIF
jgi:hypothetical protein